MNPIMDGMTAMGASARRPELATVSDVAKSPSVDTKVKFGLVRDHAPMPPIGGTVHRGLAETGLKDLIQGEVDALNSELGLRRISLNFSIDDASESIVVQVVESESGKVIRQIPPDEILALRKRLEELIGIMFDATV